MGRLVVEGVVKIPHDQGFLPKADRPPDRYAHISIGTAFAEPLSMANRHTQEFRRVLCPIDFSAHSRTALLYADELARRSGGRLFVMYVNDPLLDTAFAASAYNTEALEKRTRAELKRFVARAGVTAAVDLVAVSGRPAQEIHREARRLGADLIVMGSRGLTGVAKSLFGSTTELILRQSRLPVMVVPRLKMRRSGQRKWLRGWPGAVALIPINLADYNMADVKRALIVVAQFGSSPLFLHAIPKVRFPAWLRFTQPLDYAKLTTTWTTIKKAVGAVARGSECRFLVGDPADQIAATAAATDAGVIVLSLKRGHDGTRRGSVSYRVVASDVAPVLALPEVARVTSPRKRA